MQVLCNKLQHVQSEIKVTRVTNNSVRAGLFYLQFMCSPCSDNIMGLNSWRATPVH